MLPVVSTVAALAAVALVAMSISVSLRRMKVGVGIGFGEDKLLLRRIRAQGNFTEYVPLALIILALAEYRQAPAGVLWTIAALLVAGRCLHFVGIHHRQDRVARSWHGGHLQRAAGRRGCPRVRVTHRSPVVGLGEPADA